MESHPLPLFKSDPRLASISASQRGKAVPCPAPPAAGSRFPPPVHAISTPARPPARGDPTRPTSPACPPTPQSTPPPPPFYFGWLNNRIQAPAANHRQPVQFAIIREIRG